jgi:lipopolysaccharide export system permease protein
MTFAFYLSRIFVLSVGAALLTLGILAELLDLLDNGNAVIAQHGGLLDLAYYAALITPTVVASVLPIATLIGALITFGNLAGHNEIVAMRSSGMTIYWIVARLAPVTVMIGIAYFAMRFVVAPYTEIQVHEMLREPDPIVQPELDAAAASLPVKGAYWISSGPMIMGFERVAEQGRTVRRVTLIERDSTGRIVAHTTAREGRFNNGEWLFEGAVSQTLRRDAPAPLRASSFTLADGPQPVDILSATILNARVRLSLPGAAGANIWAGGNSAAYHVTNFYDALAAPLVPMIMLLAAAPMALGSSRYPSRVWDIGVALAAGFGYLLASGVFRSLGDTGVMPPVVAVWGPVIVFLVATSSILAHREG